MKYLNLPTNPVSQDQHSIKKMIWLWSEWCGETLPEYPITIFSNLKWCHPLLQVRWIYEVCAFDEKSGIIWEWRVKGRDMEGSPDLPTCWTIYSHREMMDRFSFFFLLFADICLLCVISLWAIGTARPVPLLVLTSSMLRVEVLVRNRQF